MRTEQRAPVIAVSMLKPSVGSWFQASRSLNLMLT